MRSYGSFFRRNRLSDGLSRAEPGGGWGVAGCNIGDLAYFTHGGFPSAPPLPGQILHAVIQPGE